MPDLNQLHLPEVWLPLVFMLVMGLAVLIYVVLDGYDLGVGILLSRASEDERDRMVAAIGPFWDANETWLVMGIGVLLVAFPKAHGVILGALYLPVAAMLIGLILRGVAFDFRVKAQEQHQPWWNRAFWIGSLLAALSQGFMLGLLVVGFERTTSNMVFAAFIGLCVAAGYCLLGAGWLLIKAEGALQQRAVYWARVSLWLTALGVAAVSVATPLLNQDVFERWFAVPNVFLLAPVPVATLVLFVVAELTLRRLPSLLSMNNETWAWLPFACAVGIFVLSFHGLAFSLFPWLVPQKLHIWNAAASSDSLYFVFVGVAIVLPLILLWTAYSYRVFWGKARDLTYD